MVLMQKEHLDPQSHAHIVTSCHQQNEPLKDQRECTQQHKTDTTIY